MARLGAGRPVAMRQVAGAEDLAVVAVARVPLDLRTIAGRVEGASRTAPATGPAFRDEERRERRSDPGEDDGGRDRVHLSREEQARLAGLPGER
jgi:hypothetical protein